jgi:hypothetical protein
MKKINIDKGRKLFMKKNVLRKGILVLLVITFLTIGLTGCGIIIPPTTTGTVDITVSSVITLGKFIIIPIDYTYDINMDGNYIGTTNNSGNLTKGNVLEGMHTFEAFSNFGTGHGSKVQNISSGINYVTITVPAII